jgi:hypothetical protein
MLKGTSQYYDELACTLREKWRREKYAKGTSQLSNSLYPQEEKQDLNIY